MIGIDEVGRGAWAGPLLIVAARQKDGILLPKVTDSKLLTKNQRESLYPTLLELVDVGEGWVWPDELNRHQNLTISLRLACERALSALDAHENEQIIIDGNYNFTPPAYHKAQTMIKADLTVPIVSVASIIAKVKRDQYMADLAAMYPEYGFESHVGYGTKAHQNALIVYGVTKEHRQFYKPVAAALSKYEAA